MLRLLVVLEAIISTTCDRYGHCDALFLVIGPKYYDAEKGRSFVFLTNQFLLPAVTIAELYRYRWRVEIFFKWIKQHLRIKKFFGTSENAVKTQIWIAISAYVLVAIMKKRLKVELTLYTILQILSISLFEKKLIYQVLTETSYRNEITIPDKQLKLFEC